MVLEVLFEFSALLVIVLFQITHVIKFVKRIIPFVYLKNFIDSVKQLLVWYKNLQSSHEAQEGQGSTSTEQTSSQTASAAQPISNSLLKLVNPIDNQYFKPYRPSDDAKKADDSAKVA